MNLFIIFAMLNTCIVNPQEFNYPPKADVISSNDAGIKPSVVGGILSYMEGEIWVPVIGHEKFYMVSNMGRVKTLSTYRRRGVGFEKTKERILKPFGRDVQFVYLQYGKLTRLCLHRLIAKHFIPNYENKPEINHIDGNRKNNAVSNLEWVTRSENQIHAFKTGLQKPSYHNRGKFGYGTGGKQVIQHTTDWVEISRYGSIRDAGRQTNINHATIGVAIRRKRSDGSFKTAGGFYWTEDPNPIVHIKAKRKRPIYVSDKDTKFSFINLYGEIWLPINGYNGKYEISNMGRAKSFHHSTNGRLLRPTKWSMGYIGYCLSINGKAKSFLAHRLVATAFIENPLNKPFVNHIDGIKTNNYLVNLEWNDILENTDHAKKLGLRISKLEELDIKYIRSSILSGVDLSKKFNVSTSAISLIRNGHLWKRHL